MPAWLQPRHAQRPGRVLRRRWPAILLAGILAFGVAFTSARLDPLPLRFTGEARASDGDSLRVGGDRVRLIGIDAPELDQVCWRGEGEGVAWPCGRDARDAMSALLGEGKIACRTEGADTYGRFLAHCEVAGRDIGGAMVSAGLAVAREGYGAEERRAREARVGLWQGRFTDPRTWRDEGPQEDPGVSIFDDVWRWFRELTGARALR